MKALITTCIIVILAITTISFKNGEARVNNFSELKVLSDSSVEQSTKPKYRVIDTLDFALEAEVDFINAFELLSEHQFLITDRYEDGKYRVLIAEGSFPKDDLQIYCSYSSSKPNTNTDWQICLRGLIERYETTLLQNECSFMIKSKSSIGLYEKTCSGISPLNISKPSVQENEASLSDKEKFDQFYNDFFLHINKNIGSVDFFSFNKKNLWSGTSGPEKYEEKLLKRLLKDLGKKHTEKIDSASFGIGQDDELYDFMYQQYINNRIVSMKFDGKAHKVVIYEVER